MNTETQEQFTELELRLALKARNTLWSGAWMSVREDKRIAELERVCRAICSGDRERGEKLATRVIWD